MGAEVITGDCVEVMRRMDADAFDLCVTSPPYDNLRKYQGYSFDFEATAKELYRVIKPGGVVVWVVGDATVDGSETGTSFRQALYFKEVGFNLHDTMIYQTEKMPLNHNRYEQAFEFMFVFSKGAPKSFNPFRVQTKHAGSSWRGNYNPNARAASTFENSSAKRYRDETWTVGDDKIENNVWLIQSNYNKSAKDKFAYQHPAIFPEELAYRHILSWSNEGDTILDPFCGSGTTGKMAVIARRNFVGIEISEEYAALARARIQRSQGKPVDIPRLNRRQIPTPLFGDAA